MGCDGDIYMAVREGLFPITPTQRKSPSSLPGRRRNRSKVTKLRNALTKRIIETPRRSSRAKSEAVPRYDDDRAPSRLQGLPRVHESGVCQAGEEWAEGVRPNPRCHEYWRSRVAILGYRRGKGVCLSICCPSRSGSQKLTPIIAGPASAQSCLRSRSEYLGYGEHL
jgi:hypothetical protein